MTTEAIIDVQSENQEKFNNSVEELKQALANHSVDAAEAEPKDKSYSARGMQKTSAPAGEKITVTSNWWGVDFILNEKLTQDIINGTVASGTVAGSITAALGAAGVITGGIATAIGAALAAAFALKVAELKIVDNGNGVHFPVTWLQWGAVLASVPTGPAGILAAIMLFIHPLRN